MAVGLPPLNADTWADPHVATLLVCPVPVGADSTTAGLVQPPPGPPTLLIVPVLVKLGERMITMPPPPPPLAPTLLAAETAPGPPMALIFPVKLIEPQANMMTPADPQA